MKDGFYTRVDEDGLLVKMIVEHGAVRHFPPEDIAESLAGYREYDFTPLWELILALRQSDIFGEAFDVRYSDFEACKNGCELIAEAMEEPTDAYFVRKSLALVEQSPDDGTASFWIEQARRMVDVLQSPIMAHTFLCRALELLYAESDLPMKRRVEQFFAAYPNCKDHAFLEAFEPEVEGDALQLKSWYLIRAQDELFFLCLRELLRGDGRLCRCECCGEYFVPRTKKMTLYCDRVLKEGKTCKELAPKLKQRLAQERDTALREYGRRYKMYYSRAERYEGRRDFNRDRTDNDLTIEEFYLWAHHAAQCRKAYITGEMTAEEFLREIELSPEN